MKTNRINTLARLTGMTIVLALLAGIGGIATAQEKGATRLLRLSGTLVEPKSAPGDYKPMACALCKDEYVSRVDWTARGANKPTIIVARHLCDGCGNKWVVSGHGKAKINTAVHTCTTCGAESLACCSTSKSGVAATKGMAKKFEVAPVK
jgi:hypothetical protein